MTDIEKLKKKFPAKKNRQGQKVIQAGQQGDCA
jgi:hypothetical protein